MFLFTEPFLYSKHLSFLSFVSENLSILEYCPKGSEKWGI